MLSPDNLGRLIQDTAAYLLKQMVSGLHAVVKGAGVSDSDIRTENFTGY